MSGGLKDNNCRSLVVLGRVKRMVYLFPYLGYLEPYFYSYP